MRVRGRRKVVGEELRSDRETGACRGSSGRRCRCAASSGGCGCRSTVRCRSRARRRRGRAPRRGWAVGSLPGRVPFIVEDLLRPPFDTGGAEVRIRRDARSLRPRWWRAAEAPRGSPRRAGGGTRHLVAAAALGDEDLQVTLEVRTLHARRARVGGGGLDLDGLGSGHLAVEEALDVPQSLFTLRFHARSLAPGCVPQRFSRAFLPRWSRDITVPIGMSMISAISL